MLLAMLILSTELFVSARNVDIEEESGIYEEYYIDTPTEVQMNE